MFVILASLYLLLSKTAIYEVLSAVAVLNKGVLPIDKGSIALQFFVDVENFGSDNCRLYSRVKMFCLENEPYNECYTDAIYSDNIEYLMPKRREALIYVYPTLYQHNQAGYCNIVIQTKCKFNRPTKVSVNIPFNTKTKNKNTLNLLKSGDKQRQAVCKSVDEDTLNSCEPVNCDLKYSGRRSFFDTIRNKCVSVPDCQTTQDGVFPDVVYVPKINMCRNLNESITLSDVYAINTGLGVVTKRAAAKQINVKAQLHPNCSTISQNFCLLKDLMTGKLCPLFHLDITNYEDCCKTALLSIIGCVISITVLLLSILCCIHTTFCFYKKWRRGDLSDVCNCIKKAKGYTYINREPSGLRREVTNNLLKQVIERDLPLELRDSVVDICDRISNDIKQKRRYRRSDLGNQINFECGSRSPSSSGRSLHCEED